MTEVYGEGALFEIVNQAGIGRETLEKYNGLERLHDMLSALEIAHKVNKTAAV
ncbi:hypothetical protein ACFORO_25795 [Amycolatopsis halotolerans]|uniref:Uncharacterized protein n=1 Tax=Amycolatopsis halotolerans TaxID=330083 RepID=A0ABV7QPR1_9PSEU